MTKRPLFALCVVFGLGCASSDDGSGTANPGGKADDVDDFPEVLFLEQGWDDARRARMYWLSQGSQLMPYAWFMALRVDDSDARHGGDPFASASHMRSMGFVVEPPSDHNPGGLPVGFAPDRDFLGLTCTACHTGQMTVDGTAVRIDGGSLRANFMDFQSRLLIALRSTHADPTRFDAFAEEVLGDEAEYGAQELQQRLGALVEEMQLRLAAADGAVEPGPGRVDGVGQATNETLCIEFEIPENCKTFNAPTNPGFLWGLGELSWVQSNGSVHGALPRNVGEALGVFTPHHLDDKAQLRTAMPIYSIVELEEGFEGLEPPSWTQPPLVDLLPALDAGKLARGAEIFAASCGTCHASRADGPLTPPNSHGIQFVEVPVTPMAEIGTDPGFVEDLLSEVALAPADYIARHGDAYLERFGTTDPAVPVPAAALRAMIIVDAITGFVAANEIAPGSEAFHRLFSFRDAGVTRTPAETMGYRAQPLEGIAFTGPYLHNGSVPTLADLLEPTAARPTEFWVGGATFDPDRVGFVTDPDEDNAYLFDTRKAGNRNTGHEGDRYGTNLSDDDKDALLEYLRAL